MLPLGAEWGIFEKLCADLRLAGDDVPDAWIAAAVTVGGLHLVTFDKGFARLLRPTEYTLLSNTPSVAETPPSYRVRAWTRRREVAQAA